MLKSVRRYLMIQQFINNGIINNVKPNRNYNFKKETAG